MAESQAGVAAASVAQPTPPRDARGASKGAAQVGARSVRQSPAATGAVQQQQQRDDQGEAIDPRVLHADLPPSSITNSRVGELAELQIKILDDKMQSRAAQLADRRRQLAQDKEAFEHASKRLADAQHRYDDLMESLGEKRKRREELERLVKQMVEQISALSALQQSNQRKIATVESKLRKHEASSILTSQRGYSTTPGTTFSARGNSKGNSSANHPQQRVTTSSSVRTTSHTLPQLRDPSSSSSSVAR